jgi:murein DD-endopeptidase MepM/ murein hydrolase activator NlpD
LSSTKWQQALIFKKKISNWLTRRYQLVVRNEDTLEERSAFSFSHAKFIFFGTVLLGILISCSLALATTLLARWLNPAYIEQENKEKIVQLATEVDTLEQQATQQKNFIALLQSIIAGKEPPAHELPTDNKERTEKISTPYSSEQKAAANALLRGEFEEGDPSSSATRNKTVDNLREFSLSPPINGIVTSPFNHSIGHYGVDVVAKEKEPIKCVADGVVVLSAWTVETGWVLIIQHNKDLISIYKHNAALLKKVGSFVKAGEVVATMGNSGELSTGPHLHFELWHEGKAMNPEHFITF